MSYHIMLLITESCNLNCVYCYEKNKQQANMSFEIARSIIDRKLKNIDNRERIVIELFGGEPFLNFKLIKDIYKYNTLFYNDIDIRYETTTNGTLVHNDIQEWLYLHKNKFSISISLDGTPSMHDKNRCFKNGCGTYEFIDIDFFRQTWPNCAAKMTISEYTLPEMSEGIQYIESLGFRCDATLSVGNNWSMNAIPIFVRELDKLVTYYTTNKNNELCTLLKFDLKQIFIKKNEDCRFCGAGIDISCFDSSGNCYPCQGFSPISIGINSDTYRNFDPYNFIIPNDNKCKQCDFMRLCQNCYAANLQCCGNVYNVDDNLCYLYKLCILASSKIQAIRVLSKNNHTHDDQLTLKAAHIIQSRIRGS